MLFKINGGTGKYVTGGSSGYAPPDGVLIAFKVLKKIKFEILNPFRR